MVDFNEGLLVRCDPVVKELIMALDKQHRVLIAELDDHNVLVRKDAEDMIRGAVAQMMDKVSYEKDEDS